MIDLWLGSCLDVLPTLPDASVDAVITDPPYPEIDRPFGRMTEVEWHAMMRVVVPECRRILKPTGSAVFILQPNSRKVGSMRPWLFEFQAWCCHEWNMVQDAWWWNHTAIPEAHSIQGRLMRPSLKACVWLGPPDCYRDQDSVLWEESEYNRAARLAGRCDRSVNPSGQKSNNGRSRVAAGLRGGVLPFNVLPSANANQGTGHPAATPPFVADWWTRYISPEGGTILDPFMGSGTTGLAALARGREFVGIERDPDYFAVAEKRLNSALNATPLFPGEPMKITGKGQPVD